MKKMRRVHFFPAVFLVCAALFSGCSGEPEINAPVTIPVTPVITSNVTDGDGDPVWTIQYNGKSPYSVSVTVASNTNMRSLTVTQKLNGVTTPVETVTTFTNPRKYTFEGLFEVPRGETRLEIIFTALHVKDMSVTETFILTRPAELIVPVDQALLIDAMAGAYADFLQDGTMPQSITVDGETLSKTAYVEASLKAYLNLYNGSSDPVSYTEIEGPANPGDDSYVPVQLSKVVLAGIATLQLGNSYDNGIFANNVGPAVVGAGNGNLSYDRMAVALARVLDSYKTASALPDMIPAWYTLSNDRSVAEQALLLEAFAASYASGNITASGLPATITVNGRTYTKAQWFEMASRMLANLLTGTSETITLSNYTIDNANNLTLDNFAQSSVDMAFLAQVVTQQLAYAGDPAKGNGKFANTLDGVSLGASSAGRDDSYPLTVSLENFSGIAPQPGSDPPFLALLFTTAQPYFFLTGPDMQIDWTKDTKVYFSFEYRNNNLVTINPGAIGFMPQGAIQVDETNVVSFTIPGYSGNRIPLEVEMTSVMKNHFPTWNENGKFCFLPFMGGDFGNIYMELDKFKTRVVVAGTSDYSGDLSLERSLVILMRAFAYYAATGTAPSDLSSSAGYVAFQ